MPGEAPCPRESHLVVGIGDMMVVFGGVKQVQGTEDLETLGDLFVLTGLEFLKRSKSKDVSCANVNLEAKERLLYEFDVDVVSKKMRWHKVEIGGD